MMKMTNRDGKTVAQSIEDVTAVAASPGNAHADHYLRGMANGLILARSIVRDEEPQYIEPGAVVEFDYMAEADKTCSVIFAPQNIDSDQFVLTLTDIIAGCEMLNKFKKLLVRGKTPEEVGLPAPKLAQSLAVEFDPNNTPQADIDLLHGIVGVITEAGEMAEVLLRRINGREFDRVNAFEEVGDVTWYLARQLRGMNADFDMSNRANIDKLHGRHGEAFDVFRDANRNLGEERKRLEVAAAPLFEGRLDPVRDHVVEDDGTADHLKTLHEAGRNAVRRAMGGEERRPSPLNPPAFSAPYGVKADGVTPKELDDLG